MERYLRLAPSLFFAVSADGTLLEVNQSLLDCLGYKPNELDGKKVDVVFPVATRIFYQTHLFPLLKLNGKAEEIYVDLNKSNGEYLPVLLNAARYEQQGPVVIVFSGI